MQILFVLNLIGTIAFAVSGAIIGIQKKMDIFGVAVLGLTTAVGGGILRDLILNITPPAAFTNPVFAIVAIAVSIITFIRPTRLSVEKMRSVYEKMLLILDSVGLGLFTVVGIQVAKTSSGATNLFMETFVGVLTGVGGGLMRDIFAGETPSIFVKHFYACASIVGAWICVVLWPYFGSDASMFIGAASIVLLRLLAAHYYWSLPKAK